MTETNQLTPEYMREWEERLGPEKVQTAIAILRSHGWGPDSTPPMWVYADAFRMAEGKQPAVYGDKAPGLDEQLLGFKLFK